MIVLKQSMHSYAWQRDRGVTGLTIAAEASPLSFRYPGAGPGTLVTVFTAGTQLQPSGAL